MTGHALRREADRPRIARGGGASTVQMITPDSGARDILNGFTDIPPGAGIPLHFHDCEESVLIVAGAALIEIEGAVHAAQAGDVCWIASGLQHRFSNPSPDMGLRIFWTYASAKATRTLVETGAVSRIAPAQG
ncbi:cupin domain-containing protein [Roseicyclus mahoneyensis]|uniref:Quercetin dioxygenase-like cupin family protein n=1 Tax=Roseicyclus mahoneyensis TaxID=164332 RepID=A0A316GB65_9RHOB|nr:cupin domain-containing protein [Roseicyclus mahoneyensis]PWK58151.1 quercetin dioxygenase-like cupin family protein [Roseicyclus mahoneyensis]